MFLALPHGTAAARVPEIGRHDPKAVRELFGIDPSELDDPLAEVRSLADHRRSKHSGA